MPNHKKKYNLKTIARKIHLYLGLLTGLVIFIVSITGALWTFKEEIESINNNYSEIIAQNKPFLKALALKKIAQEQCPNHTIHGVKYGQKNQSVEVVFYDYKPEFYTSVFINPYNGKVLKIKDHLHNFFGFVLKGHVRLWLPHEIGSFIVSYSVLLFLFIIITGLFIWFPKNSKAFKQKLKTNWHQKTLWKRKNYDLHNLLGFYSSIFIFLIAFTGCIMAFSWLKTSFYQTINGQKEVDFIWPSANKSLEKNDYDYLLDNLYKKYPNADGFEVHYPSNDSLSIYVEVSHTKGVYYNSEYLFFEQKTLKPINTPSIYSENKDLKMSDKILRMNYDIHVGAIGGIYGKTIVFLLSLVSASLPLTGILIWWNRNKVGKKFKKKFSKKYLIL